MYEKLKGILTEIHAIEGLKEQLSLTELIDPNTVEIAHQNWIETQCLFEEPEQSFFKAEWIPILTNDLSTFIDPNQNFQLFTVISSFQNEIIYDKYIFFANINELLLNSANILQNPHYSINLRLGIAEATMLINKK